MFSSPLLIMFIVARIANNNKNAARNKSNTRNIFFIFTPSLCCAI